MNRSIDVEEIISILGERLAKSEVELAIATAQVRHLEGIVRALEEVGEPANNYSAPDVPDNN